MSDKIYCIAEVVTRKKAPPKREPTWFMDLNGNTDATRLHFTSRDLAGSLDEFIAMTKSSEKLTRSAMALAESRKEHFIKLSIAIIVNDEPVTLFAKTVYKPYWHLVPSRMTLHSYIMHASGVTKHALEYVYDDKVWQ